MSNPPKWFAEALFIAQHQDIVNSWPWYGRLIHRLFIKCPCCEKVKENKIKSTFKYNG